MQTNAQKNNEVILTIDKETLSPTQLRLIKSLNSLMVAVVAAEDEAEYFETSATMIRKIAELIKHSNFPEHHKNIPYGNQAVEFALDSLNGELEENNLTNLDN